MPYTIWPFRENGKWYVNFWFGHTFFQDQLYVDGNPDVLADVIRAAEFMGPIIYGPGQLFEVMPPRA